MSYSSKVVLNWSSRFDMPGITDNGVLRHSLWASDQYFLDWDNGFTDVDAPVAGTTLDSGDQTVQHVGHLAQMVTPFACRLISISWALDMYSALSGTTGLRFVALKGVFTDEVSRVEHSEAYFTTLGVAETTEFVSTGGQVTKGTALFNSSNGDVAAGDTLAMGLLGRAGSGGSSGTTSGVITCTFETL